MRESVIEVHGLTKRYGDLLAVDGISFEVGKGEVFSLLGPNGAGKTTTVEILECLRTPTSGEARVLGYSVNDPMEARKIKQLIGVMPQEFNAIERLTVKENVELIAGIYGKGKDLRKALEDLGLWEHRNKQFGKLSGGLKRRVGIAMAMVSDPELVFLDEPTTGLDVYARRETWKFIRMLKEEGKTVFLTTHYLEEAERLSDRAAIIVKGKIAALDSVQKLLAEHGGGVRLVLRGQASWLEKVLGSMGLVYHKLGDEELAVSGLTHSTASGILSRIYASGYAGTAEMTQGGLEEVFLRLTGARLTETGELA